MSKEFEKAAEDALLVAKYAFCWDAMRDTLDKIMQDTNEPEFIKRAEFVKNLMLDTEKAYDLISENKRKRK